ncbi:MAG: hypothetical protein H7A25_24675 [Leptospiraceae bacterium]|nr:hypothetical protein [Leptospiraceae bacterium]
MKKIFRLFTTVSKRILSISAGNYSKKDTRFLFFYFSWFFALMFYMGFYLVGKNPLSLLLPFSHFHFPVPEKRSDKTLYLSDGQGNVFKSSRKVYFEKGRLQDNILILISEIGKSPYYEMDNSSDLLQLNQNLKKLPGLETAIISIWYLQDSSRLILDLREKTIHKELARLRFRVGRIKADSIYDSNFEEEKEERKKETKKIRYNFLKSTFLSIEKTLFDNFPEVKSIEFRLDGQMKQIEGLDYDLTSSKKRS